MKLSNAVIPLLALVAVYVGYSVASVVGVLAYIALLYVIVRAAPGIRDDAARLPLPKIRRGGSRVRIKGETL